MQFFIMFVLGVLLACVLFSARGRRTNSTQKARSYGKKTFKRSTKMSDPEAVSILGLGKSYTQDDVKKAHREMLKKVHPDQGGSEYLAKLVNQAKDHLSKAKE